MRPAQSNGVGLRQTKTLQSLWGQTNAILVTLSPGICQKPVGPAAICLTSKPLLKVKLSLGPDLLRALFHLGENVLSAPSQASPALSLVFEHSSIPLGFFLVALLWQLLYVTRVSFHRCPPTCCAPRSPSPPPTTSPSWQRRSTRLPRHVCSLPSSRRGWAPGWRSPQSRTSSPSLPEPGGVKSTECKAVVPNCPPEPCV